MEEMQTYLWHYWHLFDCNFTRFPHVSPESGILSCFQSCIRELGTWYFFAQTSLYTSECPPRVYFLVLEHGRLHSLSVREAPGTQLYSLYVLWAIALALAFNLPPPWPPTGFARLR
jgi:hypothetical protein